MSDATLLWELLSIFLGLVSFGGFIFGLKLVIFSDGLADGIWERMAVRFFGLCCIVLTLIASVVAIHVWSNV
jgi:hypothetical protein